MPDMNNDREKLRQHIRDNHTPVYLINTTVGVENPAWWFGAMGIVVLGGGSILYVNLRRARMAAGVDSVALPGPNSWLVLYMMICGSLNLLFGLLIFAEIVNTLTVVIFATATTIAAAFWPFLWVKAWRKSVDNL
jgi:hypothetical protein